MEDRFHALRKQPVGTSLLSIPPGGRLRNGHPVALTLNIKGEVAQQKVASPLAHFIERDLS
jgi:hypothetical protein